MVVLWTARPSRTRDSTIFALEAETATASTESGIPSPPEAHDPAEPISFPARVLSNAPGAAPGQDPKSSGGRIRRVTIPELKTVMLRTTADVVVVGAGVIGCALARELSAARQHVVVVERDAPGSGASSAAA